MQRICHSRLNVSRLGASLVQTSSYAFFKVFSRQNIVLLSLFLVLKFNHNCYLKGANATCDLVVASYFFRNSPIWAFALLMKYWLYPKL